MRRVAFLIVLSSLFCERIAAARTVQSQPSSYGKFEVIHASSTCAVAFTPTGAKPRVLFTVPDCTAEGLARLHAVPSAAGTALPSTAASGEELHLFSIATARGGNAVGGEDIWAVVVKRKGVWSARAPIQSTGLSTLTASSTRRAVFTLEQQATTVNEGLRWAVSFGGIKKTRIPKIPSTVVSKAKRTYAGRLRGGDRLSDWRPSVLVGEHIVVIHEDGKCKLPADGVEAGFVELHAEVTRWSDERESVRCLAVRRATSVPPPP